jgi:hypothetical protein
MVGCFVRCFRSNAVLCAPAGKRERLNVQKMSMTYSQEPRISNTHIHTISHYITYVRTSYTYLPTYIQTYIHTYVCTQIILNNLKSCCRYSHIMLQTSIVGLYIRMIRFYTLTLRRLFEINQGTWVLLNSSRIH